MAGAVGIIRSPVNIAPEMAVRRPVPDPATTPVIPPPGALDGYSNDRAEVSKIPDRVKKKRPEEECYKVPAMRG
ncbi:hypothetical protein [Microvirga massiliensis]|uniref:hypothetical protein n=1 Tax=Microvirga massiliensis TaxID=1033741 RepID=UPI00062B34D8|nr:hypothetical protein [Microvirga massiliensis]